MSYPKYEIDISIGGTDIAQQYELTSFDWIMFIVSMSIFGIVCLWLWWRKGGNK